MDDDTLMWLKEQLRKNDLRKHGRVMHTEAMTVEEIRENDLRHFGRVMHTQAMTKEELEQYDRERAERAKNPSATAAATAAFMEGIHRIFEEAERESLSN